MRKSTLFLSLPIWAFFLTSCAFLSNETLFSHALPIPSLLDDLDPGPEEALFELNVQEGNSFFFPNQSTPTKGYNSAYLGPTIVTHDGQDVSFTIHNQLDEPTSIHWHGIIAPGEMDGGPHQEMAPDGVWEPHFTMHQPAFTGWYHPHAMGYTDHQVYEGLAGFWLHRDAASSALGLPETYGVNDFPIVIQDRSFNEDGTLRFPLTMMTPEIGDYLLVNGAYQPLLTVAESFIRLRLLNGSNSTLMRYRLTGHQTFYQIASDGGLLTAPIARTAATVSPGERIEILVNVPEGRLSLYANEVQAFQIENDDATPIAGMVPNTLATIEPYRLEDVETSRTFNLSGMGTMVTINGDTYDEHRIDFTTETSRLERWTVNSLSHGMMMGSTVHNFHVHGTQFQLLSRNGSSPSSAERGWKDTVLLEEGDSVVLLIRFENPGRYMYHCHVLQHEEAGMMGQFDVQVG